MGSTTNRRKKRFDLKPHAFRFVDRITHDSVFLKHLTGFFPDKIWPTGERLQVIEDSVHQVAFNRPKYGTQAAVVAQSNVDTFCGEQWAEPYAARRIIAMIDDLLVPGHVVQPVDPVEAGTIAFEPADRMAWHFAHPGLGLRLGAALDGTTIVIPPYKHYGHLLTDVLMPQFHALSCYAAALPMPLHIVTCARPNALVEGFVAAVRTTGLPVQHHRLQPWRALRARRLLYARSHIRNMELNFAFPEALPFARTAFLAAYPHAGDERTPDRLYIRRSEGTKLRKVEGEAALIAQLERHGFTVFEPGWHNHREQIRFFAGASVIAGVHGAGLANILWSGPDTLLVEVMACNARKRTGLHWASQVDAGYVPLFGLPEGRRQSFAIDPVAIAESVLRAAEQRVSDPRSSP